ncbi:hypothetical protein F900_01909 [Acinetobacter modestus]|uniref:Uncharacterized protein n=1 Tax=Acinetobacter modestus TaxID=1776740 RepID=N9NFZ0_9GAMM|nr:hypothetical protein [Acinetobacter modestus]ENX00925.1 hypothetical protein F900_01909 [Acinetobacter modestus]
MHNLLTVQEAFAARQAGKSIVCRHVESEIFEKLNNVSADTWFDPHYVFAIEIETITLGGLEFTRPYAIAELNNGDEIYFCGASGKILKGKFNPENEMLVAGIKNGSVQRDEANAIAQVTAFRSLLNIEVEAPVIIDYDFFAVDEEPKKLRGPRKKKESKPEIESAEDLGTNEHKDVESKALNLKDTAVKKYIDAISAAGSNADLVQIEDSIVDDNNRFSIEDLNHFQQLVDEKRQLFRKNSAESALVSFKDNLNDVRTVEEVDALEINVKKQKDKYPHFAAIYDDLLIDIAAKREELNQLDLIENETPVKPISGIEASKVLFSEKTSAANDAELAENVIDTFKLKIEEAKSISDLQSIRVMLDQNSHLKSEDKSQLKHILGCKENSLSQTSVSELKELQKEAINVAGSNHHQDIENRILNAKSSNELAEVENTLTVSDKDHFFLKLLNKRTELFAYEDKLEKLIQFLQTAQSIDEANEPVSQTLDWTTEQRLPLITAISKRLVELGKPLIVQIREATDLNTLEAYLVQIQELIAIDSTLAHQCMQAYTVRKSTITQISPA